MSENQFEYKGIIYIAVETIGKNFGTCEGCAFDWEYADDKGTRIACQESPCCDYVHRGDDRDIIWRESPSQCKGFEIEPGIYSGCDQSGGDCPSCGE